MDVRMLFGRYNGQVRDVEPVAARAMIADGRAENPCPEQIAHVDELAEYRDACARSSTAAAKRSPKKGRS